jgi:gamma-glutamyltranspeptidase/glutathione hydrolase
VEDRIELRWSRQVVSRTEASGDRGVVVSAQREAAAAGAAMLARGGTAVDAAVATAFVEAVVEPMDATVGGCGYLLVHDPASRREVSIEFPPVAPRAARATMFELDSAPTDRMIGVRAVVGQRNSQGPLAATVPGLVAGLCAALERFGRLPLDEVLAPAIAAAEEGFVADAYLALETLSECAGLRRHGLGELVLDDGAPMPVDFVVKPEPGAERRIRQPALARTLELVAREGPDGFYRGSVARTICEELRRAGGILSVEDFASCDVRIGAPLAFEYRGARLLTPQAPCGGWTVLEALGILEHFDVAALAPGSADAVHLVAEALRHAFADRFRYLADPDCVAVPLEGLLSDEYLASVAEQLRIDAATAQVQGDEEPWQHYADRALHDPWPWDPGAPSAISGSPESGGGFGTTHLSAADASGMVVSCTHTAASPFGSMFRSSTGVILNSGMVWFDPQAGAANSIAPGKRAMTNMAPLLICAPGSVAGIGAPGGRRVTSAIAQVASNLVDRRTGIQEAIGAPRVDASGNALLVSSRLPTGLGAELERRGHRVRLVGEEHEPFSYEFARPTGVMAAGGSLSGGADPFTQNFAVALHERQEA